MGVILDVVYNHLGPDHCYHHAFSKDYPHRKPGNDWGTRSTSTDPKWTGAGVFHCQRGLLDRRIPSRWSRPDATQAIHDNSKENIIAAVGKHAREAAGKRSILLSPRTSPRNVRLVGPEEQGGYGLDGLWNDDFHHRRVRGPHRSCRGLLL